MQVKKFEAKTMKEALDLVKVHLGPEAIILSAKDSHRGFGLMGEKSVEVTAAVSDEVLRKKKVAETKLREDLREKFQTIPASKQKEFINRVFENKRIDERTGMRVQPQTPTQMRAQQTAARREAVTVGAPAPVIRHESTASRAAASGARYIDIQDEVQQDPRERVRLAAQRARQASQDIMNAPVAPAAVQMRKTPAAIQFEAQAKAQATASNHEVTSLENQVRELQAVIERFQKMPQISMSLHPGAEQGLPFELSAMYQRMTSQGVQPQLVTGMLKKAMKELDHETIKKPSMIDAWMVRHLLNTVETVSAPQNSRYHVFMGSTGQGKTTSLVKYASHLVLKEKKTIAVISLDTIKVGAADQLRIYAQILNVPFAIVRTPEEWQVAQAKLAHVQHILVDCPGFNLRSMEEVDWLKKMLPPSEFGRTIHYVQSVLARDEETFDLAGRYQMLGFHDVIFTRMDESSRQGLMLNFQDRFKVPLHAFGHGSRIPEDFEFATKERVVDFIFKLSKVSKKEEI